MQQSRFLKVFRNVHRLPELWTCVRQSNDWPAQIGGYLGLRPLRYPYEFRTPFGDTMILEEFSDLVTVWISFYRQDYDVCTNDKFIIDAGANIGAFSLFAARMSPGSRIISLEPFPGTRARLEAHVDRNQLGGRVSCLPWALAGKDCRKYMNSHPGSSQSRWVTTDVLSEADGVAVEAISLATLWDQEGIERVQLLKMDIESSEHEVLLTAPDDLLRTIDKIQLEYHGNAPKSTLFTRLQDIGFTLIKDMPSADCEDLGVAHFRLG
jgi:FkbM family methyltransferase